MISSQEGKRGFSGCISANSYNAGTGSLSYDSNGSAAGGATVFALLEPNLLLSHSLFTVT